MSAVAATNSETFAPVAFTLGVRPRIGSGCFELGKLRQQGIDARLECGDYFREVTTQ
jgi:hypothetical protein